MSTTLSTMLLSHYLPILLFSLLLFVSHWADCYLLRVGVAVTDANNTHRFRRIDTDNYLVSLRYNPTPDCFVLTTTDLFTSAFCTLPKHCGVIRTKTIDERWFGSKTTLCYGIGERDLHCNSTSCTTKKGRPLLREIRYEPAITTPLDMTPYPYISLYTDEKRWCIIPYHCVGQIVTYNSKFKKFISPSFNVSVTGDRATLTVHGVLKDFAQRECMTCYPSEDLAKSAAPGMYFSSVSDQTPRVCKHWNYDYSGTFSPALFWSGTEKSTWQYWLNSVKPLYPNPELNIIGLQPYNCTYSTTRPSAYCKCEPVEAPLEFTDPDGYTINIPYVHQSFLVLSPRLSLICSFLMQK